MTILYTQKRTEQMLKEILIALYEAVARFGCGLIGIPYKE
jgi:hypothetical protein